MTDKVIRKIDPINIVPWIKGPERKAAIKKQKYPNIDNALFVLVEKVSRPDSNNCFSLRSMREA